MSAIKYYALDGDEEVPCEFVVVRNVNGEPEFCASFVNTNYLAYENGVLLKLHQRNDELRAENAKLWDENSRLQKYVSKALSTISYCDCCPHVDCGCDTEIVPMHEGCKAFEELRELGVEVGA